MKIRAEISIIIFAATFVVISLFRSIGVGAAVSASMSGTASGFVTIPNCASYSAPVASVGNYSYFILNHAQKFMTQCTFGSITPVWFTQSGSCWGSGCWTSPNSSPRTGTGGVEFEVGMTYMAGIGRYYRCSGGNVEQNTGSGWSVVMWSGGDQNGTPLKCLTQ